MGVVYERPECAIDEEGRSSVGYDSKKCDAEAPIEVEDREAMKESILAINGGC